MPVRASAMAFLPRRRMRRLNAGQRRPDLRCLQRRGQPAAAAHRHRATAVVAVLGRRRRSGRGGSGGSAAPVAPGPRGAGRLRSEPSVLVRWALRPVAIRPLSAVDETIGGGGTLAKFG